MIASDFKEENSKGWLDLILGSTREKGFLNILDVGTGPGFFSIILSKAGHNVTGIDFSEKMIEEAKLNALHFGVKPDFLVMDVQKPDLGNQKFDLIISRNVVWSLSEPYEAYKNWKELLSPEGCILVIDGDHLRDLRDADYQKRQKEIMQEYVDTFKERPEVSYTDYKVARGWRTELPLVGKERPLWDIETLSSLGYRDIEVKDVSEVAYTDEKQKLLYKESPLFMIYAAK